MREFIPPFCLVLALMLVIAGFAVMAVEKPQPSVELHRATAQADEEYRDLLESQLERRRLQQRVMIGSFFGLAVVFAAIAYVSMRPS